MTSQADQTADEQPNPAANGSAEIAAQGGIDPETWAAMSIEEQIRAIVANVPQEVWDQVPSDLSYQHDHYAYGWPKIGERPEDPFVFDPTAPTIPEMIAEAFADVAEEDWAALPTNFAEHHNEHFVGRFDEEQQ